MFMWPCAALLGRGFHLLPRRSRAETSAGRSCVNLRPSPSSYIWGSFRVHYRVPLKGFWGDTRQVLSCCYDQIGIWRLGEGNQGNPTRPIRDY